MNSRFNVERRAFEYLRENMPDDARTEFLDALKQIVLQYNTTIPENRFTVGGVVEHLVCALLKATGLNVTFMADEDHGYDLMLPHGKGLSVKSQFTRNRQGIGLINTRGNTKPERWKDATLFVIRDTGIVYGDADVPGIGSFLNPKGDQLVLRPGGLSLLESDPTRVIAMPVPTKPDKNAAGKSLKVSTSLARELLQRYPVLRDAYMP